MQVIRSNHLTTYRRAVDAALLTGYGLTWQDACGDAAPLEQALSDGLTPEEFAAAFAEKYDLTPASDLRY